MIPKTARQAALLVLSSLCIFALSACEGAYRLNGGDVTASGPSAQNSAPMETTPPPIPKDTKPGKSTTSIEPKHTVKPGYNSYGIPGGELWQTMDENGAPKENLNEIVAGIKKKWGIPECITGIPWDDRAKKLLLDEKGALVDRWQEIVENLKQEWGVAD